MVFQFGAALLDACVLAELSRSDTYGYIMTQNIKAHMPVSESTLYPVLRRLQKENCLTTYDQPLAGRLRRYYSITERGKKVLADYRQEWTEYRASVENMLFGGEAV